MQRPQIPKRLASRIRAAQAKVTEARYGIIYDDERNAHDSARVAEYESNPDAFARMYYGNNPYNSYPVQTNISRCREGLERRRARQSERIEALATAELNLKQVEDQVLAEVNRMKPGTQGRVPWPRKLRSLERLRHVEALVNQRLEREYERQRAKDEAEFEAEVAEQERVARIEEDAFHKQWQEQLAQMSPTERDAAKNAARQIRDALQSGEITAVQIIAYLRSRGSET